MTMLSVQRSKRTGDESEARFRRTVNVVLLLAVLLDFVGQALGLFSPGSGPLLVLLGVFAAAALVGGIVHLRHR